MDPKINKIARLIPFLLIITAVAVFYDGKLFDKSLKQLQEPAQESVSVEPADSAATQSLAGSASAEKAPGAEAYLNSPIVLTGLVAREGAQLYWRTSSTDASYGFGVAQGLKKNPVFPDDELVELTDGGAHSYLWKIADGKTHYFRVCQLLSDGQCGKYSNNLWLKTARPNLNAVNSIDLTGSGTAVRWVVNGFSEKGFVLVWSKEPGPVYPVRKGDKSFIFSDPDHSGAVIEPYAGDGFYYVRVCEYLNGKCGIYSNELELML